MIKRHAVVVESGYGPFLDSYIERARRSTFHVTTILTRAYIESA